MQQKFETKYIVNGDGKFYAMQPDRPTHSPDRTWAMDMEGNTLELCPEDLEYHSDIDDIDVWQAARLLTCLIDKGYTPTKTTYHIRAICDGDVWLDGYCDAYIKDEVMHIVNVRNYPPTTKWTIKPIDKRIQPSKQHFIN